MLTQNLWDRLQLPQGHDSTATLHNEGGVRTLSWFLDPSLTSFPEVSWAPDAEQEMFFRWLTGGDWTVQSVTSAQVTAETLCQNQQKINTLILNAFEYPELLNDRPRGLMEYFLRRQLQVI